MGNYGLQVPHLLDQKPFGLITVIAALVVNLWFVTLLVRGSARGALLIAVIAAGSTAIGIVRFFLFDALFDASPSVRSLELSAAVTLTAAFCAIDLWSQWRTPSSVRQPKE